MFTIEKPTVDSLLSATMESGLGLDISKNSTGIIVYEDNQIETYQCVIEFNEESNLYYYEMVKALEDDLLSLIEGKHFDVIAIEDAIQGENFMTVRKLILLNSVIDKLIGEGKVTCNYFRRIGNGEWKKWLRSLRSGKKYLNDKAEVEDILLYLDFELAVDYHTIKDSEKAKMGYQDQLDATGVLLGAGLERANSSKTEIKKSKRSKISVELYNSEEEVREIYKGKDITQINFSGNTKTAVNNFFKGVDVDESKIYYSVMKTLGTLGVEYGISDRKNGLNHVVIRKIS